MHLWPGSGGTIIAGDSWGSPQDRPVILLHGGGQTRHAWKQTGKILARAGYHAIAYDARGHGDSEWADVYNDQLMIEDLCGVIKATGSNKPVIIGASMGGRISLVAVGEEHVDASGLVLVDVAPQIEPEGRKNVQDFMSQRPEGFDSLEEVAQAIANYNPHRPRTRNLDGLAKNVRLSPDGKYKWHWDPKWRAGIGAALDERQARMFRAANSIRIPTLLIRGGLSDVLSEAGAQSFLAQCPAAEYVNVTDAAHMVAGDLNDIFSNAMLDFLRRYTPSSSPVV